MNIRPDAIDATLTLAVSFAASAAVAVLVAGELVVPANYQTGTQGLGLGPRTSAGVRGQG